MADATVGAQIHQSLDVHRHFAPPIAFDLIFMIILNLEVILEDTSGQFGFSPQDGGSN